MYYFREFGSIELLEVAHPDLVVLTLRKSFTKLSGVSVFAESLETVLSRIENAQGADHGGNAVA